ncbi:MAG: hypothetical protein KDD62_11440, partial [Bdellovibrionales bacterium]|nr:hypothetical protein [Bdellovibrionales bacterium]
IVCSEFGLSSVQPPDLIVDAQVTRKQREVAIQEALASKIVRITEAEARLAVAQKQQMIDLLEADTQRQVGLKLTQGVNNAFIRQRTLGVLDMLSNSQDRITLIPKEALESPALMMPVFQNLMSNDSSESSSSEEPSNN